MSAYVGFEIQVEIIKRVFVVKSLIRFTIVSKQWKSLIHSSEFITGHSVNQTQPHHLLLRYNEYKEDNEYKYVSIVDDDSFPLNKFVPNVPPTVKQLWRISMLDCSHGLVCLYGMDWDLALDYSIVLLNPSIRKSVRIVLPHVCTVCTVVGFGVCPKTCDPTIVTITSRPFKTHPVYWKAYVFALSSGAWRSVSMNLCMPRKPVTFKSEHVVIDGVIHWIVNDMSTECSEMILSFDLTTEEFGEVHLPDSLAHRRNLSLSKLKESLVVLDSNEYGAICHAWLMTKNGDSNFLFAKLFTVYFGAYDHGGYKIIGFRRNGQLIRKHPCGGGDSIVTTLEAYEPSRKHISSDLGIYADCDSHFMMTSYTESLLLLNHSNTIFR